MSSPQPKTPVLLLRSTSRNFPLDLPPELERAGHPLHSVESLEDFIASPLRTKPFLAVLEIGHLADLDRALIVFDWTEQMQPLAPARYLLLLSSKNIPLGEKAMRFGSAEMATLPQPARNILFKLELQSRLLASQATEKRRPGRGFSAQLEESAGRRRILVARGQDEKAGQWKMGESSPQGKVRWRWIRNSEREPPGEKDDFHWIAESQEAPRFDQKLDAWVIEGDAPNLVCQRGDTQVYSAVPSTGERAPAAPAPENSTPAASPGGSPPAKEAAAPVRNSEVAPNVAQKVDRAHPFEQKPGMPEEKEARAGVARIAAEPSAPPPNQAAGQAAEKKEAPSIARLFEAVKAMAAREKSIPGGEEDGQPPAAGPSTAKGSSAGDAFSRADQGTQRLLSSQETRVEAGEKAAAVPRDLCLPGESSPVPTARAQATSPPATKPPGDPEDFSRAAPVNSLAPPGTEAGPVRAKEETPGTQAFRGGSTAAPFGSPPSREAEASAPAAIHRIAGEAAAPGRESRAPDASEALSKNATGESGAPAAAPGGSSAPRQAAEESSSPEHHLPPKTAAQSGEPPGTSLQGGAFNAQLPPLGGATPQARLVAEAAPLPAPPHAPPAAEPLASMRGEQAPLEPEHRVKAPLSPGAGPGAASIKGATDAGENSIVASIPAGGSEKDPSRSFLRDRHYLLMTLQELADKDSSWHPVGRYRIYFSAHHRYYGLPHPGDVLPLWIYEGELAPEFIDEQKSWKFYDRLPVAVFSLETMPHEVLDFIYKMAGKPLPKEEGSAVVTFPAGHGAPAAQPLAVGSESPDHYAPEANKRRGAWGAVADFLKKLFGGKG